ncbi:ion channel [Flavobacterium sp.]|jgi:inward rectifier potassium channel|uniref:ion channel n=1 Tax=Flavobacterium sp. TaxID=239 RepID=UPI0037C1143C
MEFLKKINTKAKSDNNTGFGTNPGSYGGRFLTKTGNANIKRTGIGFFEGISWFHTMVNISRWKFLLIILLFYFMVNLCFASIYYLIGVEHLKGINADTPLDKFGQTFFFSIQTYTTVGYGHISPSGFLTSFVAAVEALFGLLSFAIATGLFYGRFSMPKAFLLFSENALITPYASGTALMIRMTPYKNTHLTEAEVKMTVGLRLDENGQLINKFYNLDLELSRINALTLSWTLVHPITENSPFYNLSANDYQKLSGEIMVYVKVFDDRFSTTVVKRTSYTFDEIVYGAKFNPMFSKSHDDNRTLLHIDKLNSFEKISI